MSSMKECDKARIDFKNREPKKFLKRFNAAIRSGDSFDLEELRDDVLEVLMLAASLRMEMLNDTGHLGDKAIIFDESLCALNQ